MSNDSQKSTRRDLFRYATAAGAAFAAQNVRAAEPVLGMPFERKPVVRVGFIGVGGRGTGQLRNFVAVEGVQVTAICDVVQEKVERAQQVVQKAGQEKLPALYYKGDHAF